MQQILFLIHILAAISLVALILLQHGKGADMGAAFGAGASGTLFGSVGSLPFLTKFTAGVAAVFFATCLGLGYVISKQASQPASELSALPIKSQSIPVSDTVKPVTLAPQSSATNPVKTESITPVSSSKIKPKKNRRTQSQ